jgi:GNAT superfamily N-acetyltransferase
MLAGVYEGYFDHGKFYDNEGRRITIPERQRVSIVVHEERVDENAIPRNVLATHEIAMGNYLISDDKSLLQPERIYETLRNTYFAKNRSWDTISKAIERSLCFGVYCGGAQVGFARCFTDYAVTYYLCDVVIDEKHRGQGLGKALVKFITEHELLAPLMGVLGTEDAHGLYEKFGFKRDEGMYRPATATGVHD